MIPTFHRHVAGSPGDRDGGPAVIDGADVRCWRRGTYVRPAGRLERALLRLRRRN